MSETTYYLETGSCDPHYNLAFEEYILQHRTRGDYLLLWQNDNTIVIGQNQNAEEEINQAFVNEHNITVARRTTGGGAVYHDMGNLNYSFITDVDNAERMTMERFTKPIVTALTALGLDAEAAGRNDILVSGRKVSGTAQRLVHNRILHHGTLLFDANPAFVAGALNVDPTKFQSKSAKSVRSRIGNVRDFLPTDMTLEAFWTYLKDALSADTLEQIELSPEELAEVDKLRAEKYHTWEWTYGKSPRYDVMNKRKWDGGILEPRIAVEKGGNIENIVFYGDFLAVQSLDAITNALQDCPFRREDVSAVLDRFDLKPYFGGITQKEILDTMFNIND